LKEELVENLTGVFGTGPAMPPNKNEKISNIVLEEINEVPSDHENSNK
jgi:hypothetical protein